MINIENVINDTIALVSYQISLDDIRIVKIIENNVPLIEGSLFEIRELFLNIILNAIQAIGQKGVITISIKYIINQNIIKISIADTGAGISEEKITNIFDPFYTTYPENVGLGLFVCQQIVNRLRGSIMVESNINNGSVFIISIPVTKRKVHESDNRYEREDHGRFQSVITTDHVNE